KVTGQLLKNGKPLQIANDVMKDIIFYPQDAGKDGKSSNPIHGGVMADGSFEANDLPPGKYLITLKLEGGNGDICHGLFTKEKSRIIRVVSGDVPITIEITKADGK